MEVHCILYFHLCVKIFKIKGKKEKQLMILYSGWPKLVSSNS